MEMLFNFSRDGNVVIEDSRMTQCPALMDVYKHKYMGSAMVRWVANVYDYYSPYARLPAKQRKEKVTHVVFGKRTNKHIDSDLVKMAVSEYMKLQYDPLLDQYVIVNDQLASANKHLRNIQQQMEAEEDDAKKNELSKMFNTELQRNQRLVTSRQDLKEQILKEREEGDKISGLVNGENELSLLEEIQSMDEAR